MPCLTKPEAARKFPRARLYWHTTAHCWDNQPVTSRGLAARYQHDAADIDAPAPRPEIAFPSVVRSDEMPIARPASWSRVRWFTPAPMTGWPLVYDFDEPETFTPWRRRIE